MDSKRSRLTLVGSALGLVLVLLDVSAVNVALDALRTAFSTDVAGLQWIVNGYTLMFAALLLTAGALGDRLGARTMFVAGFVLFTAASVACGSAPTLAALIAGRILQGAGAALLVPNSLSLIRQAFPDAQARERAVGWWGAAGGIALAAGPLAGGFLVEHVGWRGIFLVNVPVGLAGLAMALRHAPSSEPDPHRSLDLPGQLAAIVALCALAWALIHAGSGGWRAPATLVGLLVAAAAALAFVAIEANGTSPMLPLPLFRSRAFAIASASGVALNFVYYGLIFAFSLFFQSLRKLSPQETGFAFLPMTLVLMLGSIAGGRLVARLGPRRLMVLGCALGACGYLLLLPVLAMDSYALLVLPMAVAAVGIALVVPTITSVTLSAVPASRAGVASGVLNAARQVGGMLGVSFCGLLIGDDAPAAFMQGMHRALSISVLLLLGVAMVSHLGLEGSDRPRSSPPCKGAGKAGEATDHEAPVRSGTSDQRRRLDS